MALKLNPEDLQSAITTAVTSVNTEIGKINTAKSTIEEVYEKMEGSSAESFRQNCAKLEACVKALVAAYNSSVTRIKLASEAYLNWDANEKSKTTIDSTTGMDYGG